MIDENIEIAIFHRNTLKICIVIENMLRYRKKNLKRIYIYNDSNLQEACEIVILENITYFLYLIFAYYLDCTYKGTHGADEFTCTSHHVLTPRVNQQTKTTIIFIIIDRF